MYRLTGVSGRGGSSMSNLEFFDAQLLLRSLRNLFVKRDDIFENCSYSSVHCYLNLGFTLNCYL